jgi:hypothetical protein
MPKNASPKGTARRSARTVTKNTARHHVSGASGATRHTQRSSRPLVEYIDVFTGLIKPNQEQVPSSRFK